jgi:hypothetical protein
MHKAHAGFNSSNWVTCHTLDGHAVFPMLLQLASFLQSQPKEVVILELTHIYNANEEQEDVLRGSLRRILGRWVDSECRCSLGCWFCCTLSVWSVTRRSPLQPCSLSSWRCAVSAVKSQSTCRVASQRCKSSLALLQAEHDNARALADRQASAACVKP